MTGDQALHSTATYAQPVQKLVCLFGASLNPSTDAHRNIGLLAIKQLWVDEVWYLVSPQSPGKSKDSMASFEHRVAMARLNLEGFPKLIVQDIEAKYALNSPNGVIETSDTLRLLTHDFPDHRFIWTMGADNFAAFHTWGGSQYISDNFPIALIPRAGHTEAALNSRSALCIPRLENGSDMRWKNGWCLLDAEENSISASNCREELALGKAPECMRPEVVHYALVNRIYAPRSQ